MKKILLYLLKALGLALLFMISIPSFSQLNGGEDILWITNNNDDHSTVDLLKAQDWTVFDQQKLLNKKFTNVAPDSSMVDDYIDSLNNFKVIIISNRIGGTNYLGTASARKVYSSTTTPIIISKTTAPANDFLQLLDTVSDSQYPIPTLHEGLEAVSSETEAPFSTVTFTDGKLDIRNSDTTNIYMLEAISAGNGTPLGKVGHADADSQWVWIADFAADQAAYEGADIIHKGRRIVFPFQYNKNSEMGLNEDGQAILLSLINMCDPSLTLPVGISEKAAGGSTLGLNYPNPVTNKTTIDFSVQEAGIVSIEIYDLTGKKVKSLVNDFYGSGEYNVTWNVANDAGKKVAPGLYLYRMIQGQEQSTRAMIVQ